MPGTQTPCQRSAVPAPAHERAPQPVAPAFTNHPAATRVQPHGLAVGKLPATNRHDMASPCVPDLIPWFGHVFRVPPATVPPITSKLIYINARASAARFTHNVTAAGEHPRQAPAAAIGWAARWPCAWRAGVRAICAAVGPAPSGRGPWGTVCGAALRRACVNRRPMDGQQRPRWPRAAGMFQPGIRKNKISLDNNIK